jgi:hypothetical protein
MAEELGLSKEELVFELASVAQRVHESIELFNKTEKNVFFKIMTATKGRYVVKPSVGAISPGSALTVDILLVGSEIEGNPGAIKDKFAVYSFASNEQITDRNEIEDLLTKHKSDWKSSRFVATIAWIQSMQPVSFRSFMPIQGQIKPKANTMQNPSSVIQSEMFSTVSQSELMKPVHSSLEAVIPPDQNFKKNSVIPTSFEQTSEQFIENPIGLLSKQSIALPNPTEQVHSPPKSRSHTTTDAIQSKAQPQSERNASGSLLGIMPKKLTVI